MTVLGRSSLRTGSGDGRRVRPGCGTALLLALLALGACSSPPRPLRPAEDLASPNPSIRAQAAGEAARLGLDGLVPALIELLDDEDATVRLMAGRSLRLLTGHDTGYRPYASPDEQRAQVEAWRAWWAGRTASGGSQP